MNTHHNLGLLAQVAGTLREMLGDDFDDQTFFDTLEGETDAMEIIGALIRDREEAKAHAAASKALADEYSARKRRLEDRQAAITRALGEVLDAIGQRKVPHALGTVSRTKGRASLEITDETAIPPHLTVTTVKPDNAAIKRDLDAGLEVPGARLVIGADGVTVRVK